MLTLYCTLLGLIIGSFANVCVYRIPRGESVALPGSHCPRCHHEVAWYDNIPLLSWIILRGACRNCHGTISWRYPALEALVGISWGGLAWYIGSPSLLLGEGLLLFTILWILTWIDIETMLLPDILTLPGIIVGIGLSSFDGSFLHGHWLDALIGSAAGYLFFWGVARIFLLATGREGMGYGDFKLLAMLGAFMGWQSLLFIIFTSSIIGAVAGSLSLLMARKDISAQIPFGPYLAVAGMIWFLWHRPLLEGYLQWAH
ncbi:MAG: prepilin peptidase [Mariprofundales bacterium]|nr:prepilin peptidase [Mariprofundales bacterium]